MCMYPELLWPREINFALRPSVATQGYSKFPSPDISKHCVIGMSYACVSGCQSLVCMLVHANRLGHLRIWVLDTYCSQMLKQYLCFWGKQSLEDNHSARLVTFWYLPMSDCCSPSGCLQWSYPGDETNKSFRTDPACVNFCSCMERCNWVRHLKRCNYCFQGTGTLRLSFCHCMCDVGSQT